MKRINRKKILTGILCIVLLTADTVQGGITVYATSLNGNRLILDEKELSSKTGQQELLTEEMPSSETLKESQAENTETEITMEETTDPEDESTTKSPETEETSAEDTTITEEASVEDITEIEKTSVEETSEMEEIEETTEATITRENNTENAAIKINRTFLCIGKEIELENPESYKIKWYIDDNLVADDTYTPTENDYEKWIKAEAYIETIDENNQSDASNSTDNAEPICSDSVYFSKLPVIYIDTGDDDPNPVKEKSVYIDAEMFIQNNEQVTKAVYEGDIQLKGRGNTTWGLPKKPYKIKLDSKTNLYGMGKNKHWVLLANYLDESLMRNTIASNLSKELGLVNMETVWVDVIMNGQYVGNYQLCEHIRVGDSRIDIADWESEAEDVADLISKAEGMSKDETSELEDKMKEDLSWISSGKVEYEGTEYDVSLYTDWNDDISGGYIFEMSIEYDEVSKFKTDNELCVMINSPEYLYTNDEMMEYVQNYWNAFEDAYRSEDGYTQYNGEKIHYTQMADLDSMIGYWLTMEIMGNNDAIWKSRYTYKDRNGKLYFGPVWDFDWGCGSSVVGENAHGWKVTTPNNSQNFYANFVDDPYFLQKASEKYWQIRPYLESLICTGGIFDEHYTYLCESGKKNSEKWFYARGFEQDYQMFKDYMTERIAWLDEQFDTEESITKSVYTTASVHPYIKADNELIIELTTSDNTGGGFNVRPQMDIEAVVEAKNDQIKNLYVYINGLEYDTYTVKNGLVEVFIASSELTEKEGTKNILSFIAKDDEGNTLCRNFISVIVSEGATNQINRILVTGLDVPQGGKAFDKTAICTSVGVDMTELDVTWTSEEETSISEIVQYNTSYTANMLIKAKTSAGYKFTENTKVLINGITAETTLNSDGSLSVKSYFLTDRAKLLEIVSPDEIEIAGGTAPEDIILPETVSIVTEDNAITDAQVEWDIEHIEGYDQTKLEEQNIVINGIIICPNEIDINGNSLSVTIPIHVREAETILTVEIEALTCPEPGEIPNTTVKCNNANISLVWKQGEQPIINAVGYNQTYTAYIILEANIGYQFIASTEVWSNGDILPAILNEDGTLTVTKDFISRKAKLLEIIQPEEIEIAGGTEPTDIILPEFVLITTEDKNINTAEVEWDLEHIENYSPNNLNNQNFEIKGTLLCPEIDTFGMEASVLIKVSTYYNKSLAGDVLPEDIPQNGIIPSGLWIAKIKDVIYTGTKVTPEVHVYDGKKRLEEGQDYKCSYKNNINASDPSVAQKFPSVIITGRGNYSGTLTATFRILPVDLHDISVLTEDITASYTGKVQKKVPIVTFNKKKLSSNKDFTVSYPSQDLENAYRAEGTYDILLTAKEGGNFTGTRTVKYTITNNTLISKATVKKITNQTYTGDAITPPLTVSLKKATLIQNQDYTVSYENNTSVGTATIILTGIGSYAGTKKITFKINGTPLKNVSVTGITDKLYNGNEQTQNISVQAGGVTLIENTDYEVIYTNHKNAGKSTITIKGINAYTGTVKKTFQIAPYDLNENAGGQIKGLDDTITAKYVKGGSKPKLQLTFAGETLSEGIDYTVSYKNNKAVTSADTKKQPSIIIKGKGNFKGMLTKTFTIQGKTLNDMKSPVTLTVSDKGFANKAGNYISKPILTDTDGILLTAGKDYEKTFVYTLADGTMLANKSIVPANTDIMVTVTGKGAYSGELTASYRITESDFNKAKISIMPQVYTGREITLNQDSISVKIGNDTLIFGTDYEIAEHSYSNNIKKGAAKVTIIGKGKYGGSKTVSFRITTKNFLWF